MDTENGRNGMGGAVLIFPFGIGPGRQRFSGKIELTGTLVLKDTAHIEGEVMIGKLSVEPGATFNANCSMRGAIKSLGSEQGASTPQKDEKTA